MKYVFFCFINLFISLFLEVEGVTEIPLLEQGSGNKLFDKEPKIMHLIFLKTRLLVHHI